MTPSRAFEVDALMFNAFERMVAFRYLRARKGERFVSVIAIFSLVGIALGVATLIIVMSVMNGFRQELLGRILGLNGHMGIYTTTGEPLRDFDDITAKVSALPGVVQAARRAGFLISTWRMRGPGLRPSRPCRRPRWPWRSRRSASTVPRLRLCRRRRLVRAPARPWAAVRMPRQLQQRLPMGLST